MNRMEWELRKEKEKVQILMRPSANLVASPTTAPAAITAEIKQLKVELGLECLNRM